MYVPTNSKLKVAVCISGQLRKLGSTQVPKAFSNLSPDYYIHTWDDEHNPNLPYVTDYFPDAEVQIEKYSDVFDTIFDDADMEQYVCRYHYAQFYTISKSLQMCYASGKEYDLIFRVRTDATFPMPQYLSEDQFLEQMVLLNNKLRSHYVHYFNDLDSIPESAQKWMSIKIKSMYNGYAVLDDWFWISNMATLKQLAQIDTVELVNTARCIKDRYQDTISETDRLALKSPCAWSEIFRQHSIVLVSDDTIGAQAGIIRLPPEQQKYIPGHGDTT